MTKLMQWLCVISTYSALWLAVFADYSPFTLSDSLKEVLLVSPIYLLMSFACYSLAVIGYRVATFNDCVEASQELQKQVKEARTDLQKKGFKFS